MKCFIDLSPLEFFDQAYRIAGCLERWLTDTQILEIRKTFVPPSEMAEGMSPDEKKKAFEDYQKRRQDQVRTNILQMINSAFREHPEETLELMALVCCVEPEDANNHPIKEYVGLIMRALSDQEAISFFTSLVQLGQMLIPGQ